MKRLVVLASTVMFAGLIMAAFAHVEDYGPRRYTRVGHQDRHGHGGYVVDRDRGTNWGSVIAGGVLGALAGAIATPAAPVYPAPVIAPAVGTIVPYLPGACGTVPTYNGSVLYNCGGVFYQPFYEGTDLMYQVVPGP